MGDRGVCVECQQDAAGEDVLTEDTCNDIFLKHVEPCMAANKGLVSACAKEWSEFRQCRKLSRTGAENVEHQPRDAAK